MSQLLRETIERLPAPLPIWIQGTVRYLRYPQVRKRGRIRGRVLERLASPGQVAQGPFQGMKYAARAYSSGVLPKLVGTYECELEPAIERICGAGCDRIVNIGAAEGYYAVGMALRNPEATVVGFEINPSARYYLRRLARLNGMSDRITIRGECQIDSLRATLIDARRPAIICDCEGAEDELLRPDRIEPLRRALILVETHDGFGGVLEGLTRRLQERFAPTHEIELISSRARGRDDLPPNCALSTEEAEEAMNEGRPWAQWLFLNPRLDPAH